MSLRIFTDKISVRFLARKILDFRLDRKPLVVFNCENGKRYRSSFAPKQRTSIGDQSSHTDRPRSYKMYNGEKSANIFPESEFQRRINMLRTYMSTNDITASVLTSKHNVAYFSGFLYCAFGRQYAYVVTHDTCVGISAGIDGGQPWRRTHGDNVVYTDWQGDNFYYTLETLLERDVTSTSAQIGIEFDSVTLEQKSQLEKRFGNKIKMVDIGAPVMQMRMIKSEAEIDVIKNGARIADLGGYAAFEAIKENTPEYIISQHATDVMVKEIAKTYPQSDILDTWSWVQSGLNTDGAHNPVTSRKVLPGDILSVNLFPMIQGYYTALERTAFLHHVSKEHLFLWEVNCKVHVRGCQLIKAGNRCSDIVNELNEIYRNYDLLQYRSFGYGHSFGVLCHYYGREAGLELREDNPQELRPGMVVSMEPMITIPEGTPGAGGYREHDILVIDHAGVTHNVTRFPFGPEHNVIDS